MRKSREFDNILDECLESLLTEGATVEQCLQRFPKHADELKPLLETALATRKASTIKPSPDFRDRARYQFHSALQEMGRRKSGVFFRWGWQPRWATVAATVFALFLAGGSTVAAASGSMPDDPLYPIKLATERVQLAFTFSAVGEAELHAKLADKRVAEIIHMAKENKPEQIERTAQRLVTDLTKIALLSSPREVTSSIAMAPAAEEAPVAEEAPLLTQRAGGGKEAHDKVDRRARLKEIIMHQADNNTARLHALLETAPESAKPALQRAIALSETGYKKALESFREKP